MALQPSPRLAVLLLLSHALVAIAVCLTAMTPLVRLALLGTILLSLSYYLARDALLLLPGSWRKISLEDHPHPNLLDGTTSHSTRLQETAAKSLVIPEGEGTIASSPASGRGLRRGLDSVSVTTRDGSTFSGKIAGRTAVTPWFVVLRVRPEGRYFQVSRTVFPDMLGTEEFRDLRVRLRFSRQVS